MIVKPTYDGVVDDETRSPIVNLMSHRVCRVTWVVAVVCAALMNGMGGVTTNAAISVEATQPAVPVITWSNPTSIAWGTALGAGELNATASVPGYFAYSPAAQTVLDVGTGQALSVTFTPTDTVNYTTATKTVTIDVTKATPVITWANPAFITYGTALSAAQLNATANVAGTFVYSPSLGTVLPANLTMLNAGPNQTLSVTFTPTDTVRYAAATKTVTIDVNGIVMTVLAGKELTSPSSVAVDPAGNTYIASGSSAATAADSMHRILKVAGATGTITTVAGNGTSGFSGDGGPATAAAVVASGLAVDAAANVYIAGDYRIRKVTAETGIITTVAGTGTAGYSGDGGPGTAAQLTATRWIAADAAGNVYVSQVCRIRKVSAATGVITTVAGTGICGDGPDGGPAASTQLLGDIGGVTLDGSGHLYFVEAKIGRDSGPSFPGSGDPGIFRVRKVAQSTGTITTVYSSGNLEPMNWGLNASSLAVDDAKNIYLGRQYNRWYRVSFTMLPAAGRRDWTSMIVDRGYVAVDGRGHLYVTESDGFGVPLRVVEFGEAAQTVITGQPVSQTVTSGTTASFVVTTTGYPRATYQWQESADGGSTWTNLANAAPYGGVWATTLTVTPTSFILNGRRYRAQATNVDTATSDAATLSVQLGGAPFSDPSLLAGVTPIRAIHITELRARIEALRVRRGLSAYAWTDSALVAGQTPFRAVHLHELRAALQDVYVAAGRTPPEYTGQISAGLTRMNAIHVMELRAAVVAIE